MSETPAYIRQQKVRIKKSILKRSLLSPWTLVRVWEYCLTSEPARATEMEVDKSLKRSFIEIRDSIESQPSNMAIDNA